MSLEAYPGVTRARTKSPLRTDVPGLCLQVVHGELQPERFHSC